jgi:hypothetical protein
VASVRNRAGVRQEARLNGKSASENKPMAKLVRDVSMFKKPQRIRQAARVEEFESGNQYHVYYIEPH